MLDNLYHLMIEISAAEELVEILEMFHNATEIITGEKYPTLVIVQPFLQKLLSHTLANAVDVNHSQKESRQSLETISDLDTRMMTFN